MKIVIFLSGAPIQQRWIMVFMGFLAMLNAYTMRNCLSLAITEMVVRDSISESDTSIDETLCQAENITSNTSSSAGGTFEWDESLQGIILSSFYWGYIITHIPSGTWADRFGGKYFLGLGIFSTSIITLVTPLAVEWGGSTALIVLRVLMGLGGGTIFPAMNSLLAHWIPRSERSVMGTVVFTGAQIGTVLGSIVSGLLLEYSSIGWHSVFYFYGGLGALWSLVFFLICYSSPYEHPFITEMEKEHIEKGTIEHTHKDIPPTPWRHILRSLPLWALIAAQIGHDWGAYTIITDLPLYISNVLHFSIASNGFLNALPYLAMMIVSLASSPIADWLINTDRMSITNVRKLFTTISSMGPAVFIIAASYAGCDRVVVIILFTLGMGLMGTFLPGMKINALDLSPNYAGTIMAIVNGIGAVSGIITPYLVGVLTPNQTVNEWRLVFWIVFSFFTVTNIIFIIYASGEVQRWNDPEFLNPKIEDHRLKKLDVIYRDENVAK